MARALIGPHHPGMLPDTGAVNVGGILYRARNTGFEHRRPSPTAVTTHRTSISPLGTLHNRPTKVNDRDKPGPTQVGEISGLAAPRRCAPRGGNFTWNTHTPSSRLIRLSMVSNSEQFMDLPMLDWPLIEAGDQAVAPIPPVICPRSPRPVPRTDETPIRLVSGVTANCQSKTRPT